MSVPKKALHDLKAAVKNGVFDLPAFAAGIVDFATQSEHYDVKDPVVTVTPTTKNGFKATLSWETVEKDPSKPAAPHS